MTKTKKYAVATGTRADWGLLLPLVSRLSEKRNVSIIASAMHLIDELGSTLNEIRNDGFQPEALVPAYGQPWNITAMSLTGHAEALGRINPDALIILGDRTEMLGAATAAMMRGIPIIHIAGGTVSEGAFDDAIRHSITKMASLHLPETDLCAKRIVCMGEDPATVVVSGALGVYNVLETPLLSEEELAASIDFDPGDKFILATMHPATLDSVSPESRMNSFLSGLTEVMNDSPDLKVILTYPNNDRDITAQLKAMHDFEQTMKGRVKIIPSLGRIRYLSAAALASAVVGNSSSGIVEIPSIGTPVVNIGCRQKGRECSSAVIHCESDSHSIAEAIRRALSPEQQNIAAKKENPYFKENTPRIMVDAILAAESGVLSSKYPLKKFYLPENEA